jgi:hypothetical protein
MKTNLKLNNSLSLKALEVQARKAAAIAAIKPQVAPTSAQAAPTARKVAVAPATVRTPKKEKPQRPQTIEAEIRSIFRMLTVSTAENTVVKMDKLSPGTSCKGLIGVYSRDAVNEKLPDVLRVRYAFYASTRNPSKLGSVAIYCDDVASYLTRIQQQGALFGHRVANATIAIGRRRFIDVTFAD